MQTLEDFALVPNSFKNRVKSDCPIIRRCINSRDEAMKKYKKDFNLSTGQRLLQVTTNIVKFGHEYVEDFDHEEYETCETVDDLELWELLEEDYTAYGVIGGGIKSHFLYNLFPYAFSNRSQVAIWALYFLSDKKQFGLVDDSEFLMIDVDHGTTQQNYFYPYDLFSFYALKLYLMLKEACAKKGYHFDDDYRYIYLDKFLNFVVEEHRGDIDALMGMGEYEYRE